MYDKLCSFNPPDMIAVPDFSAGAMENWGLIIYRESAMLYNPLVNSYSNKQRAAAVISHELAHMVTWIFTMLDWVLKERLNSTKVT